MWLDGEWEVTWSFLVLGFWEGFFGLRVSELGIGHWVLGWLGGGVTVVFVV